MNNIWSISLLSLILIGCGGSGGSSIASSQDSVVTSLIGTTWESSQCVLAYGYVNTKHSITFTSSELIYEHRNYNSDCLEPVSVFRLENRPFRIGNNVITESGVSATKLVITTQVLPVDLDIEYQLDVIDYIYLSNDSLYTANKDIMNCKEAGELQNGTVRNAICIEWNPILDFEQEFTKKI